MLTAPTITVVVPTYNRSWGLRRALDSVVSQTAVNFEIIVVDDSSTDDTPEVARSFTDSRIRYIRQPVNRGVARNWADGVRRARGRYLCFLMDDDFYATDRFLADRVSALERNPECVVSFGGYLRTDREGRVLAKFGDNFIPGRVFDADEMAEEAFLPCATFIGSMVYRRETVMSVLSTIERYGLVIDYALHMFLLPDHYRSVYCPGLSFAWTCHDGQVSKTRGREALLNAIRVHRDLDLSQLSPRVRRVVRQLNAQWWLQLAKYDAATNKGQALNHLAQSVWVSPSGLSLWRTRLVCLHRMLVDS